MAEKRFIIEVRTKGFARATRDYEKLDRTGEKFKDTQNKMRNNTDGLRGSLGALRNQILVYTFAIGGAVGAMNKFVNASRGFQDVKTRLVGLTGSTEAAEKAFQTFNQIASTTPFALQDVVDAGAQLEAFGLDSEATLSAVTDLAAFMGTTATEAANSLGRAFAGGAGAADILRERGILQLIKDSQGIDDLSKTTLPEFRRALLNALVDPTARIAGSADRMSKTYTGAISNMNDAITQFAAKLGDAVLPTLTLMAKAVETTFREANIQRVVQFSTALAGVSAVVLVVAKRMAILEAITLKYTVIFKALGAVLAVFGVDKILQMNNAFSSLSTSVQQNTTHTLSATQQMQRYQNTLQNTTIVLGAHGEQQKRINEMMQETALLVLENNNVNEKRIEIARMMFDVEKNLSDELKDVVTVNKQAAVQGQINLKLSEHATESQRQEFEALQRLVIEKGKNIMKTETTTVATKQQIDVTQLATGAINGLASAMQTLGNESATTAQKQAALLRTIGGIVGMVNPVAGAVISAGSMFIPQAHTGGLIRDNGIQRFANGGVVQGQDNVPILAQAGEFVMQRSAVQNIGVENLARMNNGNGAGNNVTVNISAPLVDDHILDTIIPAINNAVASNKATLS